MKTFPRCLAACLVVAGLSVPSAVHADSAKQGVFTLGVHMGNANGTLWGLLRSYDTRVSAHPGAIPLLHRQMRWSIDLAKALKMPTADLEALDRDLDKLTFAQMDARLQPILASHQGLVGKIYAPQASAVYRLGVELTLAGAQIGLARNSRPEDQPKWRKMASGMGGVMAGNITGNKLEATLSLAPEWTTRIDRGDGLDSLAAFNGQILNRWTADFGKAPAWGAAGPGVVVLNQNGTLNKVTPDAVRKGCFANIHMVNLTAGRTYVIDVTSGDGLKGPGFFDVWLRIEDSTGRVLQNDDDGGDGLNSRATFVPPTSGVYRLVVTSYRAGATGNYNLRVVQR